MKQAARKQFGEQETGDHIDLEAHARAVINNPRFAPVDHAVSPVKPDGIKEVDTDDTPEKKDDESKEPGCR